MEAFSELAIWIAAAVALPLELALSKASVGEFLAYIFTAGVLLAGGDILIAGEPVRPSALVGHAVLRVASILLPAILLFALTSA